jgi:Flp pilus assembly protein TadB
MNPKQKLMVVIPVIAALVIVLIYFGLFANPLVIAAIFVLYVAVSLRNKRKFKKQQTQD